MDPGKVYDAFLVSVREQGLESRNEWPFDGSKKCGYEAVRRWYKTEKFKNPTRAARNELGDEMGSLITRDHKSADTRPVAKAVRIAYERVELDEHMWDAAFVALVPWGYSDQCHAVDVRRLWALCMVETSCNLVLASGMSYRERYSREEVLRLVYRAMFPPAKRELRLQDPEYRYRKGAAYPAELKEFEGNTWQQLAYDADAAHLSPDTLSAVEAVTNCSIASDTVGVKTARAYIENFFRKLAALAEWLASATGNSSDAPARRDPEGAAVAHHIYMPLAEELLDLQCRNHNVTPQVRFGGESPLQRLAYKLRKSEVFRSPVGEFGGPNLHLLLPRYKRMLTFRRSNRGGSVGVHCNYGYYTSTKLNANQELWLTPNKAVTLYVQEDARFGFVVPDSNPTLVIPVSIAGRNAEVPHTMAWRTLTNTFGKAITANDHAREAVIGVGLIRGLASINLPGKLAPLLGGISTFMDRDGRNEVDYVGKSKQEFQALADYTATLVFEPDDERLEEQLELPGQGGLLVPEPVLARPPRAGRPDPFGLL